MAVLVLLGAAAARGIAAPPVYKRALPSTLVDSSSGLSLVSRSVLTETMRFSRLPGSRVYDSAELRVTGFMPCVLDPLPSSAGLSRQSPDIATFAQSFTTKELSFQRATGESLTLTRELCFADGANDTSPLCLTKSQVSVLLSQTGAALNIRAPTGIQYQ